MKQFSTEQKLQLMEQIRSRYEQNQSDMKRREHILFGGNIEYPKSDSEVQSIRSTFLARSAIALMLLVIIILLDIEGAKLFGIDSIQVFSTLEIDYFDYLDEK